MTHSPTEEQHAIITAATTTSENLMINALAGTGKSSTLKMIDQRIRTKPALYLVFNTRNAKEAEKSGEFAGTTTIRTFNACGHRIWAAYCSGTINLDPRKTQNLFKETIADLSKPDTKEAWSHYFCIMDGISKAKALGYVPTECKVGHSLINRHSLHHAMDETPTEFAADLIDTILIESITRAYSGYIDFNDQIYMPALFGGVFPKFPLVMVDEYQDQSPVNHAMLAKLVKGRIIGVGDPNQNIYGFRGAKASGMASAVKAYSMTELNLSVSFRCPSEIVKAVRWLVPNFKWTREGGNVEIIKYFTGASYPDDATIICRNNAPLLRTAFKLISAGRGVTVVGSDLGPRLVGIMKKLGPDMTKRDSVHGLIESWREERLISGSKSANDLADCMRVFADHGDTLGTAISYAEHIFKQTGTIKLLTGHKSKGLEYDNVFHLDPWLVGDDPQDQNLRYVITTRSQNNYTEVDSEGTSWD